MKKEKNQYNENSLYGITDFDAAKRSEPKKMLNSKLSHIIVQRQLKHIIPSSNFKINFTSCTK